jgi:hypothetical protein
MPMTGSSHSQPRMRPAVRPIRTSTDRRVGDYMDVGGAKIVILVLVVVGVIVTMVLVFVGMGVMVMVVM